ncbi:MAG TPA: GNAT family N-acetyltransferase [Gemmatimonadales bacterium]|nr:GNAT family N-acetyltransferase [Gemmatimonadales bacterium]
MAESGCRVDVLDPASAEWEACERSLATAGVRLPLPHRAGWKLARRGLDTRCVALRAPDGSCVGAFGVHAAASRALPGFRLLRVERFGEAVPHALRAAAVEALASVARQETRALLLTVEVFSRDGDTRTRFRELLAQAGFARAATCRNGSTTLALDLWPGEDQLLASFSATARQGIRAVRKFPVQVRQIEDPRLGNRLDVLSRESFARTGGRYEALWDWAGVIDLSRSAANDSRLVGLFRTDREGPDALLGFSWGWWNGQSVSYYAGASSRPGDLRRLKIAYPLVWDLIKWAKQTGATWFDFGGVTAGSAGSGDPLGGISDFKRFFSEQVADVAEDWVLELRPLPARLAALVGTGAAWLSRMAGRSVHAQ